MSSIFVCISDHETTSPLTRHTVTTSVCGRCIQHSGNTSVVFFWICCASCAASSVLAACFFKCDLMCCKTDEDASLNLPVYCLSACVSLRSQSVELSGPPWKWSPFSGGKKKKIEEEDDLLASLPESLYSSQHHVVSPTMLHCWAQNKSATHANKKRRAWITSGEGPSCTQNKTLKGPSVPEGCVVHKKYSSSQRHPKQRAHNWGHLASVSWDFCSIHLADSAVVLRGARAAAVLLNDSCYRVISAPRQWSVGANSLRNPFFERQTTLYQTRNSDEETPLPTSNFSHAARNLRLGSIQE